MAKGRDGWCEHYRGLHVFKCKDCDGTGHTPRLADTLCRDFPLTAVRITDREPDHNRNANEFDWYAPIVGEDSADENSVIPNELLVMLKGGKRTGHGRRGLWVTFNSRDGALQALSDSCIAYSRAKAGMTTNSL